MNVRQLEYAEPVAYGEKRVAMTASCTDCDCMPKVPDAGSVRLLPDGGRVQVMHNGLLIKADAYCGEWMTELISKLKGHHEPQEEIVFDRVLGLLAPDATMLEAGAWWSYYTLWFLKQHPRSRKAFAIEPDPRNIETGRTNARLNGLDPVFLQAWLGSPTPDALATAPAIEVATVPQLMERFGISTLDMLHCDGQGVELDVLESCEELFRKGRIRFIVFSTHAMQICGDPLMHQRCLRYISNLGGQILAEHDVHESYSGDGLIAAYFGREPVQWDAPKISYNRYSTSLFRNPAYDLSLCKNELAGVTAPAGA